MNSKRWYTASACALALTAIVMALGNFENGGLLMNLIGLGVAFVGLALTLVTFFVGWRKKRGGLGFLAIALGFSAFFASYTPGMAQSVPLPRTQQAVTLEVKTTAPPGQFSMLSHSTNQVEVTRVDGAGFRIIDGGAVVIQDQVNDEIRIVCSDSSSYTVVGENGEDIILLGSDGVFYRGPKIGLCQLLAILAVLAGLGYLAVKAWKCGRCAISNYNYRISNAMENPVEPPPLPNPVPPVVVQRAGSLMPPPGATIVVNDDGDDIQQLTMITVTNGWTDWKGGLVAIKAVTAIGANATFAVNSNGVTTPYRLYSSTDAVKWRLETEPEVVVTWLGYDPEGRVQTQTTVLHRGGEPYSTNWFEMVGDSWKLIHQKGDLLSHTAGKGKDQMMFYRAGP